MRRGYVHGHHRRERQRLQDQAGALVDLLHGDTKYPKGSRVLEAGCGVGAQTVTLARRSPGAAFVSIDVSAGSLAAARRAVDLAGLDNVEFQHADIFDLRCRRADAPCQDTNASVPPHDVAENGGLDLFPYRNI